MGAVFVTGATGTVGAALVEELQRLGEPVIAGVHGGGATRDLPPGTTTRPFTFGGTPRELDQVFDGVDRLFLMRPPAIADVEDKLFPAIRAAGRAKVKQVVFLSLQGVQMNRQTPHHAVEKYLREVKAPWTFLRPNFFMQNLSATYAEKIREEDTIFIPAGRSRTALIDARDIGRVAAAVFTSPGHVGRAYTLSGERSYTYEQVARTMSEVLGRTITYARPSEEEYIDYLRAKGMPDDYLAVQRMIHRVVRLNVSAMPNRTVRRITGQPATTLREFVADHRQVWA